MVIASRQLLILLVSIIGVCDVRCRESLTLDVYLAQSSIACRSPPKFIDLQPSKPDNRDLIGAVSRCVRPPRRTSKLPQNHFQRPLTS